MNWGIVKGGSSEDGELKIPIGLTALDGAGEKRTMPRNGNSTGWREA